MGLGWPKVQERGTQPSRFTLRPSVATAASTTQCTRVVGGEAAGRRGHASVFPLFFPVGDSSVCCLCDGPVDFRLQGWTTWTTCAVDSRVRDVCTFPGFSSFFLALVWFVDEITGGVIVDFAKTVDGCNHRQGATFAHAQA